MLGILSLVAIVVWPLAGIFLGAFGRKRSRDAGFPGTMSTVGMWVNIGWSALQLVGIIIVVVAVIGTGLAAGAAYQSTSGEGVGTTQESDGGGFDPETGVGSELSSGDAELDALIERNTELGAKSLYEELTPAEQAEYDEGTRRIQELIGGIGPDDLGIDPDASRKLFEEEMRKLCGPAWDPNDILSPCEG